MFNSFYSSKPTILYNKMYKELFDLGLDRLLFKLKKQHMGSILKKEISP